jgi:hypothetical protein
MEGIVREGEGGMEDLEGHLRKGHKSAVFLMNSALWGGEQAAG